MSAELSIRFDVADGKQPTVSVLGIPRRRRRTGRHRRARDWSIRCRPRRPDQGCALRDVDVATSALGRARQLDRSRGARGVGVGLGAGRAADCASIPRVFPDVAGVVGGVVAEAAPQPLTSSPSGSASTRADAELPVAELAVPALPQPARHQRRRARGRHASRRQRGAHAVARRRGRRARRAAPVRRDRRGQLRGPEQRLDGGVGHRPARAARPPAAGRASASGVAGLDRDGPPRSHPRAAGRPPAPASRSRFVRRWRWSCAREPEPSAATPASTPAPRPRSSRHDLGRRQEGAAGRSGSPRPTSRAAGAFLRSDLLFEVGEMLMMEFDLPERAPHQDPGAGGARRARRARRTGSPAWASSSSTCRRTIAPPSRRLDLTPT